MAFPTGTIDSSMYALLQGALASGGFDSMKVFFETAFADKFSQVRWTQLYDEAPGSVYKEYRQTIGEKSVPVIARYVAYDGDAPKISTDTIEVSSKNMPRMKLAYDTNEKSMDELQKLIQQMNAMPNYSQLLEQFIVNTAKLISGIHNQITYTGLQIFSTGKYTSTEVNNGGGLVGLEFDFQVPADNKKKAGFGTYGTKYAWSSASAYPIGDLLDLMELGDANFTPVGVIRMNKSTWYTLKNHASTRSAVAIQITGGSVSDSNLTKYAVTDAQITMHLEGLGIAPIEVIDDIFTISAFDAATRGMKKKKLRGFADNVVVASPAGKVGELQWSFPNTSFGTAANPVYVTEGGKVKIKQLIDTAAETMSFEAEFTGIPVPNNVNDLLYLDISQAAI